MIHCGHLRRRILVRYFRFPRFIIILMKIVFDQLRKPLPVKMKYLQNPFLNKLLNHFPVLGVRQQLAVTHRVLNDINLYALHHRVTFLNFRLPLRRQSQPSSTVIIELEQLFLVITLQK